MTNKIDLNITKPFYGNWKYFLLSFCLFFSVVGLNSYENWLFSLSFNLNFIVFVFYFIDAALMCFLCLRDFYNRLLRNIFIFIFSVLFVLIVLDSFCAIVVNVPSATLPDKVPYDSKAGLIRHLTATLPDEDVLSVIYEAENMIIVGRPRGWTGKYKALVETDVSDIKYSVHNKKFVDNLKNRWSNYLFYIFIWPSDKAKLPVKLVFGEDNRMGEQGIYQQENLIKDLFSIEGLYWRYLSYRNLIVYTFNSPFMR